MRGEGSLECRRPEAALDEIRERYDEYCEAHELARYRLHAGLDTGPGLEAVDDRFGDVASGDALDAVRAELEASKLSGEREGWRRLLLALESACLEARGRELGRELAARERSLVRRVGGEERTVREWEGAVRVESDAQRRRELQAAVDSGREELAELRAERFTLVAEARARLGYTTGRKRAEAQHPDVDFDAWGAAAGRLLEATEGPFRDALAPALTRARVAPDRAQLGDLVHVESTSALDARFPASALVPLALRATEGLGASGLRGLDLDVEPRPAKDPRARCFAVRPPDRVVLSLAPLGGARALREGFAAVGRGLHAAFSSSELPVERRRSGDPALGAAWALLLGLRTADPRWIAGGPASLRAEEHVAEMRRAVLIGLRRCAARARFELELGALPAGEDPTPLAERYTEELAEALAVEVSGAAFLVDSDAELGACHELRARCLEAQLAEHLRARFGREFWRERRCGELLKELWHTGWTYTAEQLADELDLGALAIESLVDAYARAR